MVDRDSPILGTFCNDNNGTDSAGDCTIDRENIQDMMNNEEQELTLQEKLRLRDEERQRKIDSGEIKVCSIDQPDC